jgi:type I restriction enzyme, S subunit
MEKQVKIPKLRFPEFSGEWERKKLGDVVSNKSRKYNPEKESDSVKCIELEHLASETSNLLGYIDGKQSGSIKNVFEKGDVLFGKLRPYLKKYLVAPFNGVCSSEIWVLTGIGISNEFLFRIIQTNTFIDLANQSSGSKMPRADWSVIQNGYISFPSLPEQQKIASFLTGVDDKLQGLKKKKSLLEQYKKGVMQRIFNYESSNDELRIRFKQDDGSDFPEWEVKKLGEVAIIRSGLSKEQNEKSSGYKVTRIETISDGTINLTKFGLIDFDGNIDEYKLKKGDILFSNINSVSHIGKTAFTYNDLELYHGMNLLCIRTLGNINPLFLFFFLNTVNARNHFRTICNQAVSQASINQTELAKTIISFPSLPEQSKIAGFLSAIDDKIHAVQQQMEKMEVWKKGLLQQMFV